jgi:hypothetical protein
VAAGLREAGWSLRRIAQHLGVSHEVVRDDLAALGVPKPARVTGTDGRRFPTGPGRAQADTGPVGPRVDQGALTAHLEPGATDAIRPPGPARRRRRGRRNVAATAPSAPPGARTGVPRPPPGHPPAPAAGTAAPSAPAGPWARVPRPSLGDSTSVRAHAGLDPTGAAPPDQPLDPAAGPVCEACGRQHPRPAARHDPLAHLVRPEAPAGPRTYGAAPPGWGRRRAGGG